MADYYLVERARGAAWDHSRRRRDQDGWDEHAAFMDALAEEGVVVLGGPVGEGDGEEVLLVVDVESEAAIRARLADDPWGGRHAHDREREALVPCGCARLAVRPTPAAR